MIILFLLSSIIFLPQFFNSKVHANDSKVEKCIISLKNPSDLSSFDLNKVKVKKKYKNFPFVAVEIPENEIQKVKGNPNVSFIEEDGSIHGLNQVIPWGVSSVNATSVFTKEVYGSGVKIGILDTGIDYLHEDLNVSGGISFVEGSPDFYDDNGHGTHVAGIIGALNNSIGVAGVAPKANLYAIKVLDKNENGNYSDVISGIDWAISNGMDLINMSFGGDTPSQSLQIAVDKAYSAGILLVSSSGNNGDNKNGSITYPAALSSVIAVGAVNEQNKRASFSSVGKELEIMAPGVNIESTYPGGYITLSGTSMAAAYVTGVAALVLEGKPYLTNIELRSLLSKTSNPLGNPFYYGKGFVDAINAINYKK